MVTNPDLSYRYKTSLDVYSVLISSQSRYLNDTHTHTHLFTLCVQEETEHYYHRLASLTFCPFFSRVCACCRQKTSPFLRHLLHGFSSHVDVESV